MHVRGEGSGRHQGCCVNNLVEWMSAGCMTPQYILGTCLHGLGLLSCTQCCHNRLSTSLCGGESNAYRIDVDVHVQVNGCV
jgi:hypothetical protein